MVSVYQKDLREAEGRSRSDDGAEVFLFRDVEHKHVALWGFRGVFHIIYNNKKI